MQFIEPTNPETGVEEFPMPETQDEISEEGDDAGELSPDEASQAEEDGQGDEDDGEDAVDTVEIEYEGARYSVPAELKDAFLRNADYTRKTQGLAAERRQLESERAQSQERDRVTGENLQDYVRVVALSEQMRQYETVNWQALQAQDPATAQRLAREYAGLTQSRNEAAQSFQRRIEERSLHEQRDSARRIEEGHRVLSRDIPDWSPELGAALKHYAASKFDLTPDELGNVSDPRFVKVLYAAFLGELRGQRARKAASLSAAQQTRPVPQVRTGGATATKNPARMSDAEYIAWRAKGGGE